MLVIRLKRLGRKGYPVYRVVVQESQRHPSSGRVVAYVGHYNPHTKAVQLDNAKIERYLQNGAQPTERVVKLLLDAKIKLPEWVEKPKNDRQGKIRFADKLRKNRPAEEVKDVEPEAAEPESTPAEEPKPAETTEETPVDEPATPEVAAEESDDSETKS
jgi:small subunit ribosomal protein S16